jgi:biotin synthase|tara:strand:+ start:191 stop:1174 length:984 start_codon:yes stop_codon:yes gene_type:complete
MSSSPGATAGAVTRDTVATLYGGRLLDLVFRAGQTHRAHRDPSEVQCAALLSVKTGGCPEDCAYCPQSAHYETGVESSTLMSVDAVRNAATAARDNGADRFCLGAAWRSVSDGPEFDQVLDMVRSVKALGLETCATLGMVEPHHAHRLRDAGLDYYNHNLDTGPDFYSDIVGTRTYEDRRRTLRTVREAGMKVCCGGILGMGEQPSDRIDLLFELASQDPQPESVPINTLVTVEGTPLANQDPVPWDDLVRMVAVARILMPKTWVRLSAGRLQLNESTQALCFLAGADSIFLGDQLLTTPNPEATADQALLTRLGLHRLNDSETSTV